MKKFVCSMAITFAMMCILAFGASAATEGPYSYYVNNEKAYISGYADSDEYGKDVVIPDTLGGYPVTGIDECAFSNEIIKSVVIPGTVDYIDLWAFNRCDELEKVVISEGVNEIISEAFFHCTALSEISIPDSVTRISSESFIDSAFCNDATNWENGVLYIDNFLLMVDEEVKTLKIKEGTITVASGAFTDADNLISLIISDTVKNFNASLSNKSSLKEVILGEGITEIKAQALRGCTSLEKIVLGDNLTVIGENALRGCTSLKDLDINNVETIGDYAFYSCSSLENLYIGKALKTVGDKVFYNCYNLENIFITDLAAWCDIKFGMGWEGDYPLENGAGLYLNDKLVTDLVVPDTVKEIKQGSFAHYSKLNSVTIPVGVVKIHDSAFSYCTNLTDVYYGGTKAQWGKIEIEYNNDELLNATIHCKDGEITEEHSHSYSSSVTTSATCGEAGTKTFTCSCGDSYTEAIIATGMHSYSNACDKECNVCKAKRSVPAHKYDNNCDASCNVCGEKRSIAHNYKASTTRATLSKDGKAESKCSVCGAVKSTSAIYYPKSIKLSATTYTYNGKTKTPSVTVKDSKGKTLKNGTDYTVTYPKKRKSIGKYTVTVTFKGNYSGTKKLTFEIIPAKAALSKLSAGSKSLTATWKTVSGVTGYEVVYSTSKNFTKKTTKTATIKKDKTKKATIKKLKKGKKYYVKVRAYKTVSGKKIYSAYSAVKNIKVK